MIETDSISTRDNDLHRAFFTFAWLWLVVSVLYTFVLYLPRAITIDERLGSWLRVVNAALLVAYLSIPALRHWLGRIYLPAALIGAAVWVLITEVMLIDPIRPVAGDTFAVVGSLSRLIVIWCVLVLISAWSYRFRYVMPAICLLGLLSALLLMSIFEIDLNPELSDFRHLARLHLLLVSMYGLVGYVVARLSQAEQMRQQELRVAHQQLAHYARDLEELTINRERTRMARELHDTMAHTMSGLSVQLETARTFWDIDNAIAKDLLDQSLVATRPGLQETRRALQALRATPLEDLGLVAALRNLVESATPDGSVKFDLILPEPSLKLPADIEQAIYRIAQEAVNNMIKHATAKTATLALEINEEIVLTVADDGVGFSSENLNAENHYGLVGMQERASLVNGNLSIESYPDKGTKITLNIERI